MGKNMPTGFVVLALVTLLTIGIVMAEPQGTDPLSGTTSRAADPSVQSLPAEAGNVTQVNIDATTITGAWQGFYGNITNVFSLENAAGDTFYNWSDATPDGEVFAARNTVTWTSINCTDGANISQEETELGIAGRTDSILNTFTQNSHAGFTVGLRTFAPNECNSTRPFDSTGAQTNFDNVILTDGDDIVYTTLLENDALGFDGGTYDFQLMVGANTTELLPYYFYVELN